jgi:hypothetical protein
MSSEYVPARRQAASQYRNDLVSRQRIEHGHVMRLKFCQGEGDLKLCQSALATDLKFCQAGPLLLI